MIRILEVLIVAVCATPFFYLLGRKIKEDALQRHQYDGMRIGSSMNDQLVEVIDPPFWRIFRLWKKRKAIGDVEFMTRDEIGKPRLRILRVLPVDDPHDCCPLCKRPYRGRA